MSVDAYHFDRHVPGLIVLMRIPWHALWQEDNQ
jgi:hypothetical protein